MNKKKSSRVGRPIGGTGNRPELLRAKLRFPEPARIPIIADRWLATPSVTIAGSCGLLVTRLNRVIPLLGIAPAKRRRPERSHPRDDKEEPRGSLSLSLIAEEQRNRDRRPTAGRSGVS